MGTILQIPQAGLATTDEKLKTKRGEVIEVLKASIEGLEYTLAEREDNSAIISKWMGLTAAQSVKAYDSVKDTYSRNGIPTDEQANLIAMLAATLSAPTSRRQRSSISLSPPQPPKNWQQKDSPAAIHPISSLGNSPSDVRLLTPPAWRNSLG